VTGLERHKPQQCACALCVVVVINQHLRQHLQQNRNPISIKQMAHTAKNMTAALLCVWRMNATSNSLLS